MVRKRSGVPSGELNDADDLEGCRAWLETCRRTPGCTGIMYTTWSNKYKLLAPFGELIRPEAAPR